MLDDAKIDKPTKPALEEVARGMLASCEQELGRLAYDIEAKADELEKLETRKREVVQHVAALRATLAQAGR